MTRISIVTAIVGASLVLGVPAAWSQAQSDAVERAVLAREQSQRAGLGTIGPDAFERAVLALQVRPAAPAYPDAHSRTFSGSAIATLPRYPDAFERAVITETRSGAPVGHVADAFERAVLAGTPSVLVDSHGRVEPISTPVSTPVASGRTIEWPQVGIGFSVGLLLALGLGMALRLTRIRPLAH